MLHSLVMHRSTLSCNRQPSEAEDLEGLSGLMHACMHRATFWRRGRAVLDLCVWVGVGRGSLILLLGVVDVRAAVPNMFRVSVGVAVVHIHLRVVGDRRALIVGGTGLDGLVVALLVASHV